MRKYILLLFFIFSFCFVITAEARKVALLVGVNDYTNVLSLNFCVNDMFTLKEALMKIGFEEDDIHVLVTGSSQFRDLPTKRNIEKKISKILMEAQPDDMVFLALSGHGAQEGKNVYFCPPEVEIENLPGTCVSINKAMDLLANKCRAKFKWMVIDACRNDPNQGQKGIGGKGLLGIPTPPDGIALFQSCAEGEESWEDLNSGNGFFTKNFAAALSGEADGDQDGKLSLMEVCKWTTAHTKEEVKKSINKTQRPYFSGSVSDFTLIEDLNVPKAQALVEEARKAMDEENYELAIQKYDEALALCPQFKNWKRERNSAQRLLNTKQKGNSKNITVPTDYPTIEEAYKNVEDGGIITILPGKYEFAKTLEVNRPVTFKSSTCRAEDVVIDCPTTSTFKITGGAPSFQNLTISSGVLTIEEGGEDCSIYVIGGMPKFFRCIIKWAGMGVDGEKANPQVESCIFKNCVEGGIGVINKGLGSFTDCEIYGNAMSGIVISDSGNPTFTACKVHDNKLSGVLVMENGLGKFKNCDIYRNMQTEFCIETSGNPTVTWCKIHDGKNIGVLVADKGLGKFSDCEIYENKLAGINVKTSGNPTVTGCQIHNGKNVGIFIEEKGLGKFSDCDIYENATPGIGITQFGNPVVTKCLFHDGKSNGAFVFKNGLGIFNDCEFYGDATPEIHVKSFGNPTVTGCKVHDGNQCGVCVVEKGLGKFINCEIYENAQPGVHAETSGNPTVTGCKIHNGKGGGVMVNNKGMGTFINNTLERNYRNGQLDNWHLDFDAGKVSGYGNTPSIPQE